MEDYKERMKVELRELSDKIDKLEGFMLTTKYFELDGVRQTLLQWQLSSMKSYQDSLTKRCIVECVD